MQLAYLLVFVLFISVSIYVDRDAKDSLVRGIPAGNGWTIESDDTQTDVDHFPPGSLSIFKEVKGSYTAGQALCLKSIDTDFDVYADGWLIYTYRPTIPKRLGRSYGMYVHTVAIPDQTSVLTLKLDPVFPEISAGLKDVRIDDPEQYMATLFRENIVTFSQSSVNLIIGILFLVIGLFSRILMKPSGLDFVSFGSMAALIGLFGFNDTLLLQVMTGHPALVRVFTYICLIFLPFPAVSFIASATGHSLSRLVPGMLALCLANMAAQVLLTHHGIGLLLPCPDQPRNHPAGLCDHYLLCRAGDPTENDRYGTAPVPADRPVGLRPWRCDRPDPLQFQPELWFFQLYAARYLYLHAADRRVPVPEPDP